QPARLAQGRAHQRRRHHGQKGYPVGEHWSLFFNFFSSEAACGRIAKRDHPHSSSTLGHQSAQTAISLRRTPHDAGNRSAVRGHFHDLPLSRRRKHTRRVSFQIWNANKHENPV
ncbi:MAG: hypothetical protein L0H75_10610, partial [Nitrosospira sp.]|nr:hypothetical protein [Nitrosospira sp.]